MDEADELTSRVLVLMDVHQAAENADPDREDRMDVEPDLEPSALRHQCRQRSARQSGRDHERDVGGVAELEDSARCGRW